MTTNDVDFEKGIIPATARPMMSQWTDSNANVHKSDGQTPLQLFQLLVGIHTPALLARDDSADDAKHRRARSVNVGLYQRAREQERASRIAYQCTSYISNALLMLQVLIAATFTALSAYKDASPVSLTVLGAMNTVLASCLAWQRGQGMPQRYRKAQDQYQALIFEIEMTERSFLDLENSSCGDTVKLDPLAERTRLQKLFDTARADQQANLPDLYVSTGRMALKDTQALTQQLEDAKAEATKVRSELMAKIEVLMSKLESEVDAHIGDAIHSAGKS